MFKFDWTIKHVKTLQRIKALFSEEFLLSYPDYSKMFDSFSNASKKQFGAVLEQEGRLHAYYARKLIDTQSHYTITELQLLLIIETLQEFCMILLDFPVQVYTNSQNLTFWSFTTERARHWQLIPDEYGPKIENPWVIVTSLPTYSVGTLVRSPKICQKATCSISSLWLNTITMTIYFSLMTSLPKSSRTILQSLVTLKPDTYHTQIF